MPRLDIRGLTEQASEHPAWSFPSCRSIDSRPTLRRGNASYHPASGRSGDHQSGMNRRQPPITTLRDSPMPLDGEKPLAGAPWRIPDAETRGLAERALVQAVCSSAGASHRLPMTKPIAATRYKQGDLAVD